MESSAAGTVSEADLVQKRIFYVARKSFLTNGCYRLPRHPGHGRRQADRAESDRLGPQDTSQLAFGHVVQYMQQRSAGAVREPIERPHPRRRPPAPPTDPLPPYFWEELQSQSRIGFIYQKLSEPRSFDYQDTRNKKYTARLRMPQFPLHARTARSRHDVRARPGVRSAHGTVRVSARSAHAGTDRRPRGARPSTSVAVVTCWSRKPGDSRFPRIRSVSRHGRPPFPLSGAGRRGDSWLPLGKPTAGSAHGDRVQGMPAVGADGRAVIFDEQEFPLEEEEDEQFDPDRLMYGFDLWLPAVLDGWPYQVGDGHR